MRLGEDQEEVTGFRLGPGQRREAGPAVGEARILKASMRQGDNLERQQGRAGTPGPQGRGCGPQTQSGIRGTGTTRSASISASLTTLPRIVTNVLQ